MTVSQHHMDYVLRQADRLDMLCRNVPVCESCLSPQVQLVGYGPHRPVAQWRCRVCKHRFEYEPAL